METSTVAATPYPFYSTPAGDDDSVQQAVLTSHVGAAVERNQGDGFASLRAQFVHRDVESSKRETTQAKFDLAVAQKDAEIRNADRFGEIRAELASLHSKIDGNTIAVLRADLSDSKQDARNSALTSVLERILEKLK